MLLLTLEYSRLAYRTDFAVYFSAALLLSGVLLFFHPPGAADTLALWTLGGIVGWTWIEYMLHRFVLHGLSPFKEWHDAHHKRPAALIGSPTVVSAVLFIVLAALPAWSVLGGWPAMALVLGLVMAYLGYGLVHHAMHHTVPALHARHQWLAVRRMWHAQHHARGRSEAGRSHFGVTTSLWDKIFGTD